MANNKMTKKEVLNAIVSALKAGYTAPVEYDDDEEVSREAYVFDVPAEVKDEVIAYALNEIELLDKKRANAATKQSKTQKENSAIKDTILAILKTFDKPVRINDIIKAGIEQGDTAFTEMSSQKASALLKQLVDNGQVVKLMDKKVATFAIPEEDEASEDTE